MVGPALLQAFMIATEGKLWAASLGESMRPAGLSETQGSLIQDTAVPVHDLIADLADGEALLDGQERRGAGQGRGGGFPSEFMSRLVPVVDRDATNPGMPKNLGFMLSQCVSGLSVMMLMFRLM